jgi:hypothetical protein
VFALELRLGLALILHLIDKHITFINLLVLGSFVVLGREEPTGHTLCLGHLVKLAGGVDFEVLAEALLDECSFLEDIDKVVRADLREVVGDDDGGAGLTPMLDSLEYEQAGCTVQCRSSLI